MFSQLVYIIRNNPCGKEYNRQERSKTEYSFLDIRKKEQIRKHKLYYTLNMFFCSSV